MRDRTKVAGFFLFSFLIFFPNNQSDRFRFDSWDEWMTWLQLKPL